MNDLLIHEQYVAANLTDRVAARALIDRHQESLNVTRAVARRAVAAIRRKAKNDAEMEQARKCLTDGDKYAALVCLFIRRSVGGNFEDYATIVLVVGSRPPRGYGPLVNTHPPAAGSLAILVGARYVLEVQEEIAFQMERDPAEREDFADVMHD